jgi:hypothetical protein
MDCCGICPTGHWATSSAPPLMAYCPKVRSLRPVLSK